MLIIYFSSTFSSERVISTGSVKWTPSSDKSILLLSALPIGCRKKVTSCLLQIFWIRKLISVIHWSLCIIEPKVGKAAVRLISFNSFIVAGKTKLASYLFDKSSFLPTHIFIVFLFSIKSFCFLFFKASSWKRIMFGSLFKCYKVKLNFKNFASSFNVDIKEEGPKIKTFKLCIL